MVTAASSAHAAVVLVDATKLKWQPEGTLELLPQTRRHSLLIKLLRVPGIIFAVNKLDALGDDAEAAFHKIRDALHLFAQAAGIEVHATIPMSALKGYNVVDARPGWCGYHGQSLLALLEKLPVTEAEPGEAFAFPVQWVEKFHSSSDTQQGRRVFWGRVANGRVRPGQTVNVLPSGQTAVVAQVLNYVRVPAEGVAGQSVGIVLDREVDVSRGDWLLASGDAEGALEPTRSIRGTLAWMDDEPLIEGRTYWALHGHRWIKAKVTHIEHSLDIHTLEEHDASQIAPNAIGHIAVTLQEPIPARPYGESRVMGSLILVDTASHKTSGALMLH
jgi:sulfate adenylyltransferase subunit 1